MAAEAHHFPPARRASGSPWRTSWRRFSANKLAVSGLVFLLILGVGVLLGPVIYGATGGTGPYDISCSSFAPASSAHPLGCDSLGRDVLARLLVGGRVSLTVGLAVAAGSTLLGILVGAAAGYFGGKTDSVLMQFTDTVIALPSIFLVLAAAALLGPSLTHTILILSLIEWTTAARLVRSEFLSIRERDFVTAARAVGLQPVRVVRQILINVVPTIMVAATLIVATAILSESGLSFLGMGTQPPQASWGYMLSNAQTYIFVRPQLGLYPGVLIVLTVLAVNFVGDGLRHAFDPKYRNR
jgi:peptide/nickel transport system permease protein